MREHRHGAALVRLHGKADPDKIKAASERFMKAAIAARKKAKKAVKE
jgi:hypothetical protein